MEQEQSPESLPQAQSSQPVQQQSLPQKTIPQSPIQQKPLQKEQILVNEKPTFLTKCKSWLIEYKRVLRATKKPDNQEFLNIVKISGIGIMIIGFIGFLISMIKELLF